MNHGSIEARFVRTGVPVKLSWANGIITSVEPAEETPDVEARWIAPALVDLQINGYAGVDFQQDDLPEEELLTAVRALRRHGCTRVLFTLITDHWSAMLARLQHARKLVELNPELRTAIAGWHIEGPFLSAEPGFCGAHDPAKMIDPTPTLIDELGEAAGGDPVLLTVAPEREGSIDAIRHSVSRGMKVSLGHTNASSVQLTAAACAGATGFTHLANGCPQTLDRHDNILWRVLDTAGLSVSLIHDTHHVSPQLFRLIHRALKPDQIMHTTDAMSAAGAKLGAVAPRGLRANPEPPDGRRDNDDRAILSPLQGAGGATRPAGQPADFKRLFNLGNLQLEVGEDGIVRQPGRTNFAGSSLTPVEGVFRAARMTGKPWQEMWMNSSLRPAEFMGWTSELKVGQPADFCVIETTDEGAAASLIKVVSRAESAPS